MLSFVLDMAVVHVGAWLFVGLADACDHGCPSPDWAQYAVTGFSHGPRILLVAILLIAKRDGNELAELEQVFVGMKDYSVVLVSEYDVADLEYFGSSPYWYRGIFARSHCVEKGAN